MKYNFKFSMKLTRLVFSLLIVHLLLVSSNCKNHNDVPNKPVNLFRASITFIQGKVLVNNKQARPFQLLNEGSIITTAKKSIAIIQFGSGALITLKGNSSINLKELIANKDGKPSVSIIQKKGYSFNKIKKGSMNYKILSVTSVAAVRGTSFSFSISKKGKTKIKLLKGWVKASPVRKGKVLTEKTVELKAGKKFEITKNLKVKVKKLKKTEKKSLKLLNTIKLIPRKKIEKIILSQIAKKKNYRKQSSKQNSSITKTNENVENDSLSAQTENLAVINTVAKKVLIPGLKKAKKSPKKMSLAQLKKKYGKLSKLLTQKGKAYIGILKDKGSSWEIITTSGKHYIKKKDVQKIKTY